MTTETSEKVDYDKLGYCVKCHKYMRENKFIYNKWELVPSGDASQTEFLLSNGTRMKVAICKSCKTSLSDTNYPDIMKSVIKGWQKEMELLNWDKDKVDKYNKDYDTLEIVCKSEKTALLVLNDRFDKYKKSKNSKAEPVKGATNVNHI